MERRRVRFTGRVQGVGFRATALAVARDFAVTGWVANQMDGSVVVEVQGESSQIEVFLGLLRDEMGSLIGGEEAHRLGLVEGEGSFEVRR